MKKEKLDFLIPKKENNLGQWLIEQGISAGFPLDINYRLNYFNY